MVKNKVIAASLAIMAGMALADMAGVAAIDAAQRASTITVPRSSHEQLILAADTRNYNYGRSRVSTSHNIRPGGPPSRHRH